MTKRMTTQEHIETAEMMAAKAVEMQDKVAELIDEGVSISDKELRIMLSSIASAATLAVAHAQIAAAMIARDMAGKRRPAITD